MSVSLAWGSRGPSWHRNLLTFVIPKGYACFKTLNPVLSRTISRDLTRQNPAHPPAIRQKKSSNGEKAHRVGLNPNFTKTNFTNLVQATINYLTGQPRLEANGWTGKNRLRTSLKTNQEVRTCRH